MNILKLKQIFSFWALKVTLALGLISAQASFGMIDIHFKRELTAKALHFAQHPSDEHSEAGLTPLIKAINARNIDLVREFLFEKHANVEKADSEGFKPIHWAAVRGKPEIIKMLHIAKANITAVDSLGQTSLHVAVKSKDSDSVKAILAAESKPAFVNSKFNFNDGNNVYPGASALSAAIILDLQKITLMLLNAGADINQQDDEGFTPIMRAINIQNKNLIKQLLRYKPNLSLQITKKYNTISCIHALGLAVLNNLHEIIPQLVAAGASVNQITGDGFTALHLAAFKEKSSYCLEKLLKPEYKPNLEAKTNQQFATTDSDFYGATPLILAVKKNNYYYARLLLNAGANIEATNKSGSSPLLIACKHGFKDIAQLLMARGANPNVADLWGNNALHLTIATASDEIIPILFAGTITPDLNAQTNLVADHNHLENGRLAALHLASLSNNPSIVQFLLQNGADIKVLNQTGMSALHFAARNHVAQDEDCRTIIKQLLAAGCDINAQNQQKLTPLHIAIVAKRIAAIQFLCDSAARTDLPDNQNKTALMLSLENVTIAPIVLNAKTVVKQVQKGKCPVCDKPADKLMCSRCKNINYCSSPCQVTDWPTHKKNCKSSQPKQDEKSSRPQSKTPPKQDSSLRKSPSPKAVSTHASPFEGVEKQREQDRLQANYTRSNQLAAALVAWNQNQSPAHKDAIKALLEQSSPAKLMSTPAHDDTKYENILERVMNVIYRASNAKINKANTSHALSTPHSEPSKQKSSHTQSRPSRSPQNNKPGSKPSHFSAQRPHQAVHVPTAPRDLPPASEPVPHYLREAMREHALRETMPELSYGPSSSSSSSSSSCSSSSSASLESKSSEPQETLYGHLLSIAVGAQENRRRRGAFAAHHENTHAHSAAAPETSHTHDMPEKPAGADHIFWDHIFVGNTKGGLHHDENKVLEKAGKVTSTGEQIDTFGSYRARVTQLDNRANSFFPSSWSINEVKEVISRAAANIHEWEFDKDGNQVGIASVFPPVAHKQGLAQIKITVIFKGSTDEVITAYPINSHARG